MSSQENNLTPTEFAMRSEWFETYYDRLKSKWRMFIEETGSNIQLDEYCFAELWPQERLRYPPTNAKPFIAEFTKVLVDIHSYAVATANHYVAVFEKEITGLYLEGMSSQEASWRLATLIANQPPQAIDEVLTRMREIAKEITSQGSATLSPADLSIISEACQSINAVRLMRVNANPFFLVSEATPPKQGTYQVIMSSGAISEMIFSKGNSGTDGWSIEQDTDGNDIRVMAWRFA